MKLTFEKFYTYHTATKKKAEDEAAAAEGETSQKSVLESLCVVN